MFSDNLDMYYRGDQLKRGREGGERNPSHGCRGEGARDHSLHCATGQWAGGRACQKYGDLCRARY